MQKLATILTVLLVFLCTTNAYANSADLLQSFTVNGEQREWRILVPSTYTQSKVIPLVLDFHGTSSSPNNQAGLSAFELLGEREGFMVVTPAAKYIPEGGRVTWNVDKHDSGVDDVAFIRQLIAHLKQHYSIDPARVYATGFSGGARMSSRIACDLTDTIAAIGPVAGVRYPEDCKPSRPVPIITFHGKKDRINHYQHQDNSPIYWRMGVEEALEGWIKNNHCEKPANEQAVTDEVTKVSYLSCQQQGDIVFYRSDIAGHTWPGSPKEADLAKYGLGETDTDIPATELIWQFFAAHPLP